MISQIVIVLIISAFLAYIWVNGLDKAQKNWPDYKGEDMLDEYPIKKKKLEGWDDNKQHTEQDIR